LHVVVIVLLDRRPEMLNDFGIPAFVRDVPDALYCQKEPLFIGGKLYFARIPVVRLALRWHGNTSSPACPSAC
jgi:hypothetical protein